MSYIGKSLTPFHLVWAQVSSPASSAGPTVFEFEDNLIFADENLARRISASVDMTRMTLQNVED